MKNVTLDFKTETQDLAMKQIAKALENLEYGTVQITVHNSRIVQIDRIERTRIVKGEILAPHDQF